MKKVILILMIVSVQAFAWFGLELKEEKVMVEGYELTIVDTKKNSYWFNDSLEMDRKKEGLHSNLKKRIEIVFEEVNRYGKSKGFKSYSLKNDGLQPGQIGLNSGKDIADYCTMNMTNSNNNKYGTYWEYCSSQPGVSYPLLHKVNETYKVSISLIYFTDETGGEFPVITSY